MSGVKDALKAVHLLLDPPGQMLIPGVSSLDVKKQLAKFLEFTLNLTFSSTVKISQ